MIKVDPKKVAKTVTGRNVLEHRGEFYIHNACQFGVVSTVTSALGDFLKAEIWRHNPEALNGIELVFDKTYGASEVDKAIKIIRIHFPGKVGRLDPYRCPANRSVALGWCSQDYRSRS
jgi:hypothetical protein